ncbi:MAG: hypothetical protein WKF75_07680 [Singulisphaera sp.]
MKVTGLDRLSSWLRVSDERVNERSRVKSSAGPPYLKARTLATIRTPRSSVVVSTVSAKAIVRRRVGLPCRWRRLTRIKVSTRPKPRANRGNDQGTLRARATTAPATTSNRPATTAATTRSRYPAPGESSSPSSAACPIGAPRSAQYRTRKATSASPATQTSVRARNARTRPVMRGGAPGP